MDTEYRSFHIESGSIGGRDFVKGFRPLWHVQWDGGGYEDGVNFLWLELEGVPSEPDVVRVHVEAPRFKTDPFLNSLKAGLVGKLLEQEESLRSGLTTRYRAEKGRMVGDSEIRSNKSTSVWVIRPNKEAVETAGLEDMIRDIGRLIGDLLDDTLIRHLAESLLPQGTRAHEGYAQPIEGSLKEQHELAVGEQFMHWYNNANSTHYRFERKSEAPDLLYTDGDQKLGVEVTCAYYDKEHASLTWLIARQQSKRETWPSVGMATNPDEILISQINERINSKYTKRYGGRCLLVIHIEPLITSPDDLVRLRPSISIPENLPFEGLYLAGNFPYSRDSTGGFHCWRLSR